MGKILGFKIHTGKAHPICVIKKAAERGFSKEDLKNPAKLKPLIDECVREGKFNPIYKLLERFK